MQFNMKQTIYYGDLCYIKGYGNSTWEVIGYTFEWSFLNGKVEEEIIYVLYNVHTGEKSIAYQEDLTLVCRALYAYEYIRQLENGSPPKMPVKNKAEENTNMKVDRIATMPHKYPNTINGLLDELTDLLGIVEVIGEEESVMERIETVKQRLDKKRLEKLK